MFRLVPMTKTVLLGLTLVAVLTMAIVFPAVADAITPIKQTEIKVKKGEISKLRFQLEGNVETQPFGGYAIFTDGGAVVAVTSHAGFYDSETQTAPTVGQTNIQFGGPAAVCNVVDVACGNEWHTHLVEPTGSGYCDFAAVSELTFEQPSDRLNVAGNNLIARGIALGTSDFTEALGGNIRGFDVGTPLEGGAAFDLNPAVLNGLKAVCIGDVSNDPANLCADIGGPSIAEAQAYKLLIGGGGLNNKIDIDEFPYNDNLWADINTNTGDVTPEGLGGQELKSWYIGNCQ